jgi:hypothetical protein
MSEMDTKTEKQIKASFIGAMTDELHYLDQIYKYMKHLEHIYKVGKLQDEEKAWHVGISLSNTNRQREKVKNKIKQLREDTELEEWRLFDRS